LSADSIAGMVIRDAEPGDWAGIWPIVRDVVRAGDTFCWDRSVTEDQARSNWMHSPPGRTFVAVDSSGTVLGTAESHRNQGGGGSHVASAGFMVAAAASGRGVGRALGEHVIEAARADGFRAMQFNAVVATNTRAVGLWRSLGFEVVGTIPDGFLHPELGYVDLLAMHRAL
jgi:L-amino acid N-acyltransferase YncA